MAMSKQDYINQGANDYAMRASAPGHRYKSDNMSWQAQAWREGFNAAADKLVLDSMSQVADPKDKPFAVPTAPILPSQGKTMFGRPDPDYIALEMRSSDVLRRIDSVTGPTTGRVSSLEAALTPIPVTLAKLNKTMREAAAVMNDLGNRLRSPVPAAVSEHIRVLEEQAKKETNEARATRLLIKVGKITSKYASRGMQV